MLLHYLVKYLSSKIAVLREYVKQTVMQIAKCHSNTVIK